MNEDFLSYLWTFRLLSHDLHTESGEPLAVLHPGDRNTDGGPDFFNARLRIGETTWAGNVEIHVRASQWLKHGHQDDPAYDNAILHVVYEADAEIRHPNGVPLQTLVVRNRFREGIFDRYCQMMENRQWIPCENQLSPPGANGFKLWAPALAVERLVHKSQAIRHLFDHCRHDWEETLYRHMASAFGFRINSMPFELLAKSLPLKIVRRHADNRFRLEALLFGQSGLLVRAGAGAYPEELMAEYLFLQQKYDLKPVDGSCWKFLRLRPVNFPTLRISQWAGFVANTRGSFFGMLEDGSFPEVIRSLDTCAASYWDNHYTFDKVSASCRKVIGQESIRLLVINGIVPFLFFLGLEKDRVELREKALDFLERTAGEHNAETLRWRRAGLSAVNALHTQALLQLKRFYCDKKRCLECRIGAGLLAEK